jgi:transcriptional regulator with XRE-family HTH domain
MTFSKWLLEKIEDSGLSYSEIGRRGEISHARISQVIGGEKPGWDFCVAIARVFRVPPEEVFRRAGLLPANPNMTPEERELLHLYRQLGDEQQKMALRALRAWSEGKGRK